MTALDVGLDLELARVAAVLLDERVLRRVIKKHRKLHGVGLQVPHAMCDTIGKAELVAIVEPDELRVDPAALPDRVTIFAGARGPLMAGDTGELSRAWRALFHARVHQALDDRLAAGALTAGAVRARIHRIGQIEFDEIRSVLRQEDLLFLPADDTATYIELVATYLELQQFAPDALARTFPTVDLARVDAAIALDLDPAALLAASRPPRAPIRPLVHATAEAVRAHAPRTPVADGSARERASKARVQGNRARAAILALRAGDREQARKDLDELCERLSRALGCPGAGGTWTDALLPLAELAAAQRVLRFTAAARLLHDLQTACVVAERETKVVDTIGWALSLGKRPVVRSLPATREVRVAKHVHAAADKLAGIDALSDTELARLTAAIHDLGARGDTQIRVTMRPKIEAALDEVDLHPHNLPERVADKKLVDELLDQVVAVGRLSLGNLRDAVSHNDLKMPDLQLRQLRTGDALLRCDHVLSRSLDGVYRRGEGYLRFLQKASSILFGTPVGRFLSLYIILPLLGSFTVFKGTQEIVELIAKHTHHAARELAAIDVLPSSAAEAIHAVVHDTHHATIEIATPETILGGAVFLFLVLHVGVFRRGATFVLRQLGRGVRVLAVDVPRAILAIPIVRRALASRFTRWVIKPGIPPTLFLLVTDGVIRWPLAAAVFIALALMLNSRAGRNLQELTADALVRSGRHLTGQLVPATGRWILDMFAELMEITDRGLYRVDEWLRFKGGESRATLVVKGALGTVWSVIAYLIRLYINLFIEPVVNPIKHFPVVTVAAKLMVPFYQDLMDAIGGPASQLLGSTLGKGFAAFTLLVIPGLAGFLVWELKENWKLYQNTRAKILREVSIGHHGESMVSFLKPGFHSGTIPKRFTKLRRAAWKDDERGIAKHRDELHHIEDAVHKFADRELVSILNEAAPFRVTDIAVGHIAVGSNRVQIELTCGSVCAGDHATSPVRIAFELQSGWLLASLAQRGWIDHLADDQRGIFELALAGFYKRAGVDLVREQIEQVLAGDDEPPPYDISDEGLIVWPGDGYQTEAVYDLRATYPSPRLRGAPWQGELPTLTGRRALFYREPLGWSVWTQVWEQIGRHEPPRDIVVGPSLILAARSGRP
jgi:hypothetical protein